MISVECNPISANKVDYKKGQNKFFTIFSSSKHACFQLLLLKLFKWNENDGDEVVFLDHCLLSLLQKEYQFFRITFVIRSDLRVIYNGNWNEWNAIWAEITCVISKLNKGVAWVRFETISMVSDQNCPTQGSVTTLLHPFWNRQSTGLGQFNAVLSWFEIKFIHFLGGKNKTFGNKSCKICLMILIVFHFPAIWLVIFQWTLKSDWLFCF